MLVFKSLQCVFVALTLLTATPPENQSVKPSVTTPGAFTAKSNAASSTPVAGTSTAPPINPAATQALVVKAVILPLSEGGHLPWIDQICRSHQSDFWTPSATDIASLEQELPANLTTYYRQYLGVTMKNGKRLIYVNGFDVNIAAENSSSKFDWHSHAVHTYDREQKVYTCLYNVQTHHIDGPYYGGSA